MLWRRRQRENRHVCVLLAPAPDFFKSCGLGASADRDGHDGLFDALFGARYDGLFRSAAHERARPAKFNS